MELPIEPTRRYTVAEYLAIDKAAETRYEYRDGEIIPMCGAEYPHEQITGNLHFHLRSRLASRHCQPAAPGTRVRAVHHRRYCYPDAAVVCGAARFDPPDQQVTLVNPAVVFEVLSNSTEPNDRGEKFARYRQTESVKEYLLVAHDRPQVEPYYLDFNGLWRIAQVIEGLDGVVHLHSLCIDLPLTEIYKGVTFPLLPPQPEQPD